MFRFERTQPVSEGVGPGGEPYTLTTEQFSVCLATGPVGFGATYAHPRFITRNGETASIPDLVFLVRLIAALLLTLAAMVRMVRR